MRKLALIFLFLAIMTGVSVQAHKQNVGIRPRQPQKITIQDDKNEGYMVFDLVTGAYQCYLCEYQYSFSGTGSVKLTGCQATFSVIEKGYTMTAYANICEQTAKCFIDIRLMPAPGSDIGPVQEILSDSNLRDSVATCITREPPPPPFEWGDVILQNDVDGSFLLIVPSTGAFKFVHCEDGSSLSGTGKVTREGSWLSFEVLTAEYRVLASINLSEKSGKVDIEVFVPIDGIKPMQETISDNNLNDNVLFCGPKK
jgi:hypothetical protein